MDPRDEFNKHAEELKFKVELYSLLSRFGTDGDTTHALAIASRDARDSLKKYIAAAQRVGTGFGAGS
ncbi:hypothetical protein ACN28S_53800 [Cystobacter fuscus]